ncbi:MAG: lipid A biosynthesis acyltransferase [Cyclobacteriaceae bacterium]|nr:lipid A biosynthesis acyltransferase [Cyclobacteriaceae bacterium]
MPEWQGKSKGTPLGYKIFIFICRTAGITPAYFLLRFVALYYFLFSPTSTRHIYQYFRQRHHWGKVKACLKVYRNYFVFGQTLLDKIVVMAGISNTFTYDFDGEENLHEMVRRGKGGILLSAHVGNWEAAGHLLRKLNTRINVVMFDGEHQRIKAYLDEVTGGRNFNVIGIKADMSHVYAIGDALRNNELICLHADRFLEGNKTKVKNFLDGQAKFPEGPFALATTFKVPVSIAFAFKESSTHYHFFGSQLLQQQEHEQKTDYTERLMETFVQELEQKVKLYPEQWFNYYKFWD